MKLLITGGDGQLAHAFRELSGEAGLEWVFCNRAELDLSSDESIRTAIDAHAPDVVINCAAYTAVDLAEENEVTAMRINGDAVGVIAEACEKRGAHLIQISTDYVFSGEREKPYPTDAKPAPINAYGRTKLVGENLALKNASHCSVVRTSWLYSDYGKNFATTMRSLFQQREELRVVNDQVGRPTRADELAAFCLKLARNSRWGKSIYHCAGKDIMSWYDFACQLKSDFEGEHVNRVIHPISSEEFPTPAARPRYSVLEI